MRVLDLRLSVRGLPLSRSLVLTVMAMLLAAADWLPENPLVDSDYVEFLLSSAFGISAIVLALRDRGTEINFDDWPSPWTKTARKAPKRPSRFKAPSPI